MFQHPNDVRIRRAVLTRPSDVRFTPIAQGILEDTRPHVSVRLSAVPAPERHEEGHMTTFTGDHHLDVDALGVSIRIDGSGLPSRDLGQLTEAWSGARSSSELPPVATVTPRPRFHFDDTVADVTTQVTLAALAARRGEIWMVHAGAVADEHGRVVMFSGRSGMGKTTLMSRLAREFAYVTDESVGIDAGGGVLPYRKPLSIIDDAARAKRQASPAGLGLRELPDAPLRLHAIVVLDRAEIDTPARLEPLDIADAIGAIAPQCSYLSELDAPLRTIVGHIEGVGGALRLRYREAEDTVALVRAVFAAPPRTPLTSTAPQSPIREAAARGFGRTPVLDAISIDGDRLVLMQRSANDETAVHIIDGVGPALWWAADGVSFDELVAAAVRRHGIPADGDAASAVRSAVEALCAAGLIEERPGTEGAGETGRRFG